MWETKGDVRPPEVHALELWEVCGAGVELVAGPRTAVALTGEFGAEGVVEVAAEHFLLIGELGGG